MPKTVVDCGNCGPDYQAIRRMIESRFDARVVQTHGAEDTLELIQRETVSLICVNRKLDRDYSDGIDVIRAIKSHEAGQDIPVMLVTNYEEHQELAMQIGAARGFGKLSLQEAETHELLRAHLDAPQPTERMESDVS